MSDTPKPQPSSINPNAFDHLTIGGDRDRYMAEFKAEQAKRVAAAKAERKRWKQGKRPG